MQPKFNFYDFVGYIIPGALALALLYWLCQGLFAVSLQVQVESLGQSIIFVLGAYFVGHLVQAFGNWIEDQQVKKWKGWFSEQFLRDDNDQYTPEFKTYIKRAAQQLFKLSPDVPEPDGSPIDEKKQKKRRQEIFNLCYSLVVQEGVALHADVFNGVYSLYRGMLAAIWFGIVVSGLIALKHLALWLVPLIWNITLPKGDFWNYEEAQLQLGLIFLVIFIASIRPVASRYKRFSQHFANSVYRSFYTWYASKYLASKSDKQSPPTPRIRRLPAARKRS